MTESLHLGRVWVVPRHVLHVLVVLLHYADVGVSVKEMSSFRQIRRAGLVHDGVSTISGPLIRRA